MQTALALSRIEGGGGVPTIAMLDRIATAMRTTFMGDEAVSMAEARYAEHRALQDKGAGG